MRRPLVKLRIGCHNLRVETGRYDKISLDERICPLCLIIKLRTKPTSHYTEIDDIRKLSHENLRLQLMNSNDYYVNLRLLMVILSFFEMRDKLI